MTDTGTVNGLYRPRTINSGNRKRRTNSEVEQLDRQIIDELESDHPQSIRHLYYRMTNPRLPAPVDKSDRGYRAVQYRGVELRRAKRVPYGYITDATRRGYFVNTFDGGADFLRQVTGLYRADLWEHAARKCEVWVESRSIAGVIEDDCKELAVSLYPAGGFSSISLAFQAAESLNATYDGREVVIFYIGDYDPAGVLIDVALERELRSHLHAGVKLRFERIGITSEQVAQYDLPTKPRKDTERRAQHIKETVEAEAMPAQILRGLLRSKIEALLPARALEVARAAEASERGQLLRLADALEGRS